MNPPPTNFIQNLPLEVDRNVFNNLDSTTDKITCQTVCKSWTEEARASIIRHFLIESKRHFNRMWSFLSAEENEHKFLLIKTVTFGRPENAEKEVEPILTRDVVQLIRRLPYLEGLSIQDGTACVSTFAKPKVVDLILINCPKFKNFIINKKLLSSEWNEAPSYH